MPEKSYKDWYDENRKELARKRRERYKNDAEYRNRALARSREYKRAIGETPRIVEGDPVTRGGKQGWRRSSVAYKLNVSMSTLKRMLRWTPDPTLPGRPSAWTDRQVALLKAFVDAQTDEDRAEARTEIFAKWNDG